METFVKGSITVMAALQAAQASLQKAASLNLKIAVAVTDETGELKALLRMDGTSLLSLRMAQEKAHSASISGVATHQWYDFIKNDPPLLHGLPAIEGIVLLGGGIPIFAGPQQVGAIGVSGGHYSQDMLCAQAGLEAIGATSESTAG